MWWSSERLREQWFFFKGINQKKRCLHLGTVCIHADNKLFKGKVHICSSLMLWLAVYLNHGCAGCQLTACLLVVHPSLPPFVVLQLDPDDDVSPLPADVALALSAEGTGGTLEGLSLGFLGFSSCSRGTVASGQLPARTSSESPWLGQATGCFQGRLPLPLGKLLEALQWDPPPSLGHRHPFACGVWISSLREGPLSRFFLPWVLALALGQKLLSPSSMPVLLQDLFTPSVVNPSLLVNNSSH